MGEAANCIEAEAGAARETASLGSPDGDEAPYKNNWLTEVSS